MVLWEPTWLEVHSLFHMVSEECGSHHPPRSNWDLAPASRRQPGAAHHPAELNTVWVCAEVGRDRIQQKRSTLPRYRSKPFRECNSLGSEVSSSPACDAPNTQASELHWGFIGAVGGMQRSWWAGGWHATSARTSSCE